ncbi:hypothetical protein C0992_006584 [Termitomyces sp. T32_za158]|nr:hypothetical protein C0992_006584 [Termitomyces sp. T32_za158]
MTDNTRREGIAMTEEQSRGDLEPEACLTANVADADLQQRLDYNGTGNLPAQAGEATGPTINHGPNDGLEGFGDGARYTQAADGIESDEESLTQLGVDRDTMSSPVSKHKRGGSASTRPKWNEICQLMREKDIDILALQETHLDNEKTTELNKLFVKQIHFTSSLDPDKPNTKGVAFAIRKKTVKWQEARYRTLIPGRALVIEVPWYEGNVLCCLNVYTPNQSRQNEKFWKDIRAEWNTRPRMLEPNILLGDMNIVEEAIDRLPQHTDDTGAVNALASLKARLRLADGW